VKLLPGEKHRERALSEAEADAYVQATTDVAHQLENAYRTALTGIRATVRGQQPRCPDASRLRDVALLILEAGLRPDECYRLTAEDVRDGAIWIADGKTKAAVRRIPIMTERLKVALDMRMSQVAVGG
jgi:integrase